jgi:histone acetyltransferase (RNA polymerase elongator complex component)
MKPKIKVKIKLNDEGQCIACVAKTEDKTFIEAEAEDLSLDRHHKEPYASNRRREQIKDSTKKLLAKHGYIFGLGTGWNKDLEYKTWCEEIIKFSKSFDDKIIHETFVKFPVDPWGEAYILDFFNA